MFIVNDLSYVHSIEKVNLGTLRHYHISLHFVAKNKKRLGEKVNLHLRMYYHELKVITDTTRLLRNVA